MDTKRYTTAQLQVEFKVIGFGYGYVAVERKSDGLKGSMDFNHSPRIYHSFVAHK